MLRRLVRGTSRKEIADAVWVDDPFSGQGSVAWPGGSQYKGSWRGNNPHGKGIYTWFDGSRYEGEWQNGLPHGRGRYISSDGTVYEGEWRIGRNIDDPDGLSAASKASPPAKTEVWDEKDGDHLISAREKKFDRK